MSNQKKRADADKIPNIFNENINHDVCRIVREEIIGIPMSNHDAFSFVRRTAR